MNPGHIGMKDLLRTIPDRNLVRQRLASLLRERGPGGLNEVFSLTLAEPAGPADWEVVTGASLHRLLAFGRKTVCGQGASGPVYDICLLSEQSILILDTLTMLDSGIRERSSVERERSSLQSLSGKGKIIFLGLVPGNLIPAIEASHPWDLPPADWSRVAEAYGDDPLLVCADRPDRIEFPSGGEKLNGFRVLELVENGESFLIRRAGGQSTEALSEDLESGAWLFRRYETDFCRLGARDGGWFDAREFARKALDASRLARAFFCAENLHRKQRRRGSGIPYTAHLLGVATIAMEHGADEDETIAALLHDSLEDQGGEGLRMEIRRLFGPRVLDIVEGCTEERVPGRGWKGRKKAHADRMRRADSSVALVYASDKLHNLRSVLADYRRTGERTWDKFHAGRDEQLWYYRELTGIFRGLGHHPELVDEIERTLAELEGLILENGRA